MFLWLRLLGICVLFFGFFLKPIYWLFALRKSKKVPKIENDIFLCSATELARRIRQKQVTSEYVIANYIQRIKEVDKILNAVSDDRYQIALNEAIAADNYIQNNSSPEQLQEFKPFLGVPITIKESCGLKGCSQAVGCTRLKGIKAQNDCPSVKLLKRAGFIPLLVTNCPEYCVGLETTNLINGTTKNPYNTNRTTGGSSGGEAALLGAGATVVGLGSDFAGSIRLPCLFNGIYGHKTSPKIVEREGHFPDSTDIVTYDYFAIGPMGRYAADLKPLLKIIAGKNAELLKLDEKVDLGKIKIYHAESTYNLFGIPAIDKDICDGISTAMKYFEINFDTKIEAICSALLADAVEISTSLFMDIKNIPNYLVDKNDPKVELNLYVEILKSLFGKSEFSILLLLFICVHRCNGFVPKSRAPYYQQKMIELKTMLISLLGDDGVLLYPTFHSSAFRHYEIFLNSFGISYAMIFNILGFPTTQIPIGLDRDKMPIGFQIVAAPHMDRMCLAVAEELEKCFGGWVPPYSI